MIFAGLCSVTFRSLSVRQVVALAEEAGLFAIEWGGDVHVPSGDLATAQAVREMCREAGLATPTYGSYFRTDPGDAVPDFRLVLDSAQALGASSIRIWAGKKSSADLTTDDFQRLVDETRRVADLATAVSCRVAFEYHLGTATDTNEAAANLLRAVNHPAVRLYWQPRQGDSMAQRQQGLQAILPYLDNLHVFQWLGSDPVERRPLSEGKEDWSKYLELTRQKLEDRYAFLEFVRDDSVRQFQEDAQVLRQWLMETNPPSREKR